VLIAGKQDDVAPDVVVEAELGGQVTLLDRHTVVGVHRVLDPGAGDEVAPEGVARLDAELP